MIGKVLSSVTCEARDDMDVDVRDLLTGSRVVVDDDVASVVSQNGALLCLDLLCHKDHMGQDLIRAACHVGVGLTCNDKAVAFLDGVDVENDEADVVFIDAR